ncbi:MULTISPECIES: bifunctional UDP-sugar hydrolase/5'-nucleotidase [unclassified Flavobacterium]|jgi:5'-nucleotidase|uniref:bifunctional metallophosphatase/5'-nucleotidase n=1 Tax=unclassified Flavobacterium TaxID=196869 RepID=UPI00057F8C1E|nr:MULTISPECIES: metallophosphatase [unclassified Flavobacterium]KIA98479.1 5'-nucleotidase [Flavobacterium sp. KMS]KIA98721.1 5'-nucleotidase [Flavobacterium sp. JRM]MEA9412296.1 metallophosphatase [Flavobacterium sp. PL02]OUL60140.1 metallophosphatase [Flavobacterium sp. AJR]
MKRRDFIEKTAASTALLSLGLSMSSFTSSNVKHITILHTNDVHSHIDPFPADDPRNANMGGVSRRAALIDVIRKENPNVLLLDAGDIFQGTPYFNYYGGELEFKLMSMMKYDASTIGNHDFDNGLDGLYAQMPHAKFEFISSNYDFKNTVMDGLVKPYKIFNKDGIKIGVFGLGIQLDGLVDKLMYKETVYNDPVETATDMVRILKKEQKCDLVICLSHLGYKYRDDAAKICDLKLAELTQDIDLIIGGHTHTFLDKPTVVKNKAGEDVLVNQVGCYGINLGRIDFYLNNDKTKSAQGKSIIV